MAKRPLQLHEDLGREHEIVASSNRSFGLVFAVAFAILAGLSFWRGGERWPIWLGASAAMAVVALAAPVLLGPANRAWTKLGLLLFRVVNPIVMMIVYALTIVPIGVLMRLSGRDLLKLRFDPAAESYWVVREKTGRANSMKNQF